MLRPALTATAILVCSWGSAAPVPRTDAAAAPPAGVVGTWDYDWGWGLTGRWAFFDDATYTGYDSNGVSYCGNWTWSEGLLTLWDCRVGAGGDRCAPNVYVVRLEPTPTGYVGRATDGTAVALNRPPRP